MTSDRMSNRKFFILMGSIVAISIVLDLVTKIVAENNFSAVVVPLIGEFVYFTYVLNYGASFGMMQGSSLFFFAVTVLGLPLMGFLLAKNRKNHLVGSIGLASMIGGTIGNAIDRAFLGDGFFNGPVRDFIGVKGFAVFNVADSFLVCGVILFVLSLLFFDADALLRSKKEKTVE